MSHIITICSNTETILSSYDLGGLPSETGEDLATEFTEHLANMIRAADLAGANVDFQTCGNFQKYHGGKFAEQAEKYGQTGGLVSCERDSPKIVHELCERAENEASRELEGSIEKEVALLELS